MATVLITGASSGIGKSVAVKAARLGHDVIAVGRRHDALIATQQEVPNKIHIISADIAEEGARQRVVEAVVTYAKPFYVLHNAGIANPMAMLGDIPLADWRYQMAVNLEAPCFLTQALLPQLSGGRVMHVSSGLAHHPLPGVSSYCLSKAALYMLYQCLREELKDRDIAVGSMNPGPVDTGMQIQLRQADASKLPVVELFINMKQQGQLLPPAIVADFILWLFFEVSKEQFSAKEWDVRDTTHHHQWLKDKNVTWGGKV